LNKSYFFLHLQRQTSTTMTATTADTPTPIANPTAPTEQKQQH